MKNYRIHEVIGHGSYSKVYLATHYPTETQVAIKAIEKSDWGRPEASARIDQEIRNLKQLRHPNLIELYQISEDSHRIYLIMQYAQKGDLLHLIKTNGALKEETVSHLMRGVLQGLQHMHACHVCHRDVKLANLLMSELGAIKLTDLGLSKSYCSGVKLTTSCGSPCFAAPQLISLLPYDPHKSDIWSAGVVFYALLASKLPFEHHNLKNLYEIIKKGIYSEPDNVTQYCKDLLSRMLTVNPEQRISISQALQHPFFTKHHQSAESTSNPSLKDQVSKLRLIQAILDEPIGFNPVKILKQQKFDHLYAKTRMLLNKSKEELHKMLAERNKNKPTDDKTRQSLKNSQFCQHRGTLNVKSTERQPRFARNQYKSPSNHRPSVQFYGSPRGTSLKTINSKESPRCSLSLVKQPSNHIYKYIKNVRNDKLERKSSGIKKIMPMKVSYLRNFDVDL